MSYILVYLSRSIYTEFRTQKIIIFALHKSLPKATKYAIFASYMESKYTKVYNMAFATVFPLLIAKAERKQRTRSEVLQVTSWLTGYPEEQIISALSSDISYGDFFRLAPALNPLRENIKGSVCGVKLDSITEPLMLDIRRLDKLVDDLAKGKSLDKILPK